MSRIPEVEKKTKIHTKCLHMFLHTFVSSFRFFVPGLHPSSSVPRRHAAASRSDPIAPVFDVKNVKTKTKTEKKDVEMITKNVKNVC